MSASSELVAAIGRVVERLSAGAVEAMAARLEQDGRRETLLEAVPAPEYRAAAAELVRAWDAAPGTSPEAIALALRCARERFDSARSQRVSIVWTGPESEAVPVRMTEQALLQVVNEARERLIVVSFAVYKVDAIATALVAAAERGVRIALVLESEHESGGKVDYEMASALGQDVLDRVQLYTWPGENRPTTPAGTRASLHAKCAVADGRLLLVSSANLTEFAMSVNMELGLLVEGGATPAAVQTHFEQLIDTGMLRLASWM